jgi:hypothetical protein
MEEKPRDKQADPDDESEQAENIYRCQFPDAFFPQFFKVRDYTYGEKGENKEHHPEDIALISSGLC